MFCCGLFVMTIKRNAVGVLIGAELVLNAINYACGTNGTLVVRAINLSPPIVPPRIQLGPQQGAPGKSG